MKALRAGAAFASLPLGLVLGIALFFTSGCEPKNVPSPVGTEVCLVKDRAGNLAQCPEEK